MIIWSGLGIIVPIIMFLCGLLASLFFESTDSNAFYGTSLLISVLPILVIGFGMEGSGDEEEEESEPAGSHSFFFIPIKWWSLICLAVGLYLVIKG